MITETNNANTQNIIHDYMHTSLNIIENPLPELPGIHEARETLLQQASDQFASTPATGTGKNHNIAHML